MSAVAAPAAAGAPAAGAPGAVAPAAGGWSLSGILRMLLLYWVVSSYFGGSKTPPKETKVTDSRGVTITHAPHRPMWREHTPYDMYVYVHHLRDLNINEFTASQLNPSRLVWFESGLIFGSWDSHNERAMNWSFTDESWMMKHMHANGTLYAHTFFVRDHSSLFQYLGQDETESRTHDVNTKTWKLADSLVLHDDGSSTSYALNTQQSVSDIVPLDTKASDFPKKYKKSTRFNPQNIIHRVMELNVYRPAPKVVEKKNLLGVGVETKKNETKEIAIPEPKAEGEEDEDEVMAAEWLDEDDSNSGVTKPKRTNAVSKKNKASSTARPYLSFWKPFLSIRLIPDFTVFPYNGIPAEMAQDYVIDRKTDQYAPIVYFDYFWLLSDQLTIINSTVTSLSLNMSHSPLSLMKWRMELQMEQSWKMQQQWGMQEEDGRESEMFKRMVLDTNIYLLAITFIVSMLHMVFDFLAFKNDVAFWKNAKSMKGLSTRSILMNCICQGIIFLYLCDNDTSYMILASSGIGIIIEIWKVQKALVLKLDYTRPFPYIRIMNKSMSEDKAEEEKTEDEKEMELHSKYDAEAMVYLSYVCYPLIICYAIYSIYYESHKSWYSFVLGVLTGCVYTFGFIMMCPQLYLNYKLQSVAHLPWRMLTYKALNTFIDDLFSFVITMPTMHRLACFRDDIIFFIYLYQKWAYRTDYKRVNEFGTVLMSEEEQKQLVEKDRLDALKKLNLESEQKRGAYLEEITDEKEEQKVVTLDDDLTTEVDEESKDKSATSRLAEDAQPQQHDVISSEVEAEWTGDASTGQQEIRQRSAKKASKRAD